MWRDALKAIEGAVQAEDWRATGDPLTACLDDFWAEDQDAAVDLLRQNPALSDTWRHRWAQALKSVAPRTLMEEDDAANAVETWFDTLANVDLDQFIRENPGPADAARTALHRTRSMLRGMAVKAYMYDRLRTDESLHLPDTFEITDFLSDDKGKPLVTDYPPDVNAWLNALDPLRSGIFDLAEDPLGVWQTVRSDV